MLLFIYHYNYIDCIRIYLVFRYFFTEVVYFFTKKMAVHDLPIKITDYKPLYFRFRILVSVYVYCNVFKIVLFIYYFKYNTSTHYTHRRVPIILTGGRLKMCNFYKLCASYLSTVIGQYCVNIDVFIIAIFNLKIICHSYV